MKTVAILTVAFVLTALAIRAEDAPKAERGARPEGPGVGRMAGMFGFPPQIGEKLNLTDEQKQKMMEIGQKYRPQMEEIRKKMMEEAREVLTDEQKKKLDAGLEEMRQRFQQGRGQGDRPAREGGERKPAKEEEKK
jgi:Spy/CpxP family protein refolding chaperone